MAETAEVTAAGMVVEGAETAAAPAPGRAERTALVAPGQVGLVGQVGRMVPAGAVRAPEAREPMEELRVAVAPVAVEQTAERRAEVAEQTAERPVVAAPAAPERTVEHRAAEARAVMARVAAALEPVAVDQMAWRRAVELQVAALRPRAQKVPKAAPQERQELVQAPHQQQRLQTVLVRPAGRPEPGLAAVRRRVRATSALVQPAER
jgi:hypothetical protein